MKSAPPPTSLTSSNLSSLPDIRHGFFGRNGGVSKGIYTSLNCGLGSGDDKANVIENRKHVAAGLGADENKFLTLYQHHSADVITVEHCWRHSKLPKADAMVTKQPFIALGVLAADCVPVLFADPVARVIGAAHSGWNGTLAGVLENTIAAMEALGATRESIAAAIGPSIAQQSYEVSSEFRDKFLHENTAYECYFIASPKQGHYLFDLKGLVKTRLSQTHVGSINLLENDTYIEEDDFFSFRRATHRGEPDYGRQISAILLTR